MTSPFGSAAVSAYPTSSGNSRIDPLIVWGLKWGNGGLGVGATVSYSFPQAGATWIGDYGAPPLNHEPFNGFQAFNAAQQDAAEQALASWADVANITFTETSETTSDVGDIRFGFSAVVTSSTAVAWAYFPSDAYPEAGDVWFDHAYAPNLQMAPGQFGFSTLVHEIGHAIGLDHPFSDSPGEPVLPAAQDNQRYSIMSYTLYSGSTIEAYGPMLYDILAIQYLYGANMTTHAGDDVYTFLTNKEYLECIWDAGGHDTIDLSNQTRNQVIDLREGMFSSIGIKNNNQTAVGNVGVAYNAIIEDAIGGSGNDKITGNDIANYLQGGAGTDNMDGGAGADIVDGGIGVDTMAGGKGDDIYMVDNAGDIISETLTVAAGGGIDLIVSTVSYSLASLGNVENLALNGGGNLNATGNATSNAVIGNSGSNVLNGGGGSDLLFGGAGNDVYVIDNAGDIVNEQGNSDLDDELRSANVLLSATAGIEHYTYTGAQVWSFTGTVAANKVSGGSAGDTLNGAEGNDVLSGNAGNDTLIGGIGDDWLDGGAGNDKLKGGSGNDVYVIGAAGDVIDEEGKTDPGDAVRSTISINLAVLGGGAVEHATLLGAAAINATGNASKNSLTGNDGANVLDGGADADILSGGKGNDTYIVDNLSDQIVESAAGGLDLVKSSVSFNLVAFANVENLTLTGVAAVTATGNDLGNVLTGNDVGNVLNGGIGVDTMAGGKGDDIYMVDNAGDVVSETLTVAAGGGIDLIVSTVSYSLASLGNVENLALNGGGNLNATGNATSNAVIGNSGSNVLNGGGGGDVIFAYDGADTLIGGTGDDYLWGGNNVDKSTGGSGRDTFDFDHLSEAGDTIMDFALGAAGDILNIADLLDDIGYAGSNPFADSILSFGKVGANTLVSIDADGLGAGGATTLATLLNVTLTQANTDNYLV